MEPTQVLRAAGLIAARRLNGRFFRAVERGDPLNVESTRIHGGRYNARWEFAALYCSESPELAIEEEAAQGDGGPVRVVSLQVALARVLDLADPFLRDSFLLREHDLTSDDYELTQRIGRAARTAGFEALLVPSAHGGRNLVVFLDRLTVGSRVTMSSAPQASFDAESALADMR